MTSNEDTTTAGTPAGPQPRGDRTISRGTHVVSSPDAPHPLVMEFQARVVTGPTAEPLAREQAAAIREVLTWIARKHSPENRQSDRPDE